MPKIRMSFYNHNEISFSRRHNITKCLYTQKPNSKYMRQQSIELQTEKENAAIFKDFDTFLSIIVRIRRICKDIEYLKS